jgi:hypothetical protein
LEKVFIYLALAKPALPGQFVLFVSSQSKANVSKYFYLFQCTAQNKSNDFCAAQKYFIIRKQHKFSIFVSFIAQNWLTLGSKNLITEQNKMLDFLIRENHSAVLPKVLPPTPKLRFHLAASTAKLAATTKLPLLAPLPPPLPPPCCHFCGACHAANATAKLLPPLPPTLLRCRTAAALPSSLRCRSLRHRTAASTATAKPPHCLPPPRFCRCRPATTANAALPSMTPLLLF